MGGPISRALHAADRDGERGDGSRGLAEILCRLRPTEAPYAHLRCAPARWLRAQPFDARRVNPSSVERTPRRGSICGSSASARARPAQGGGVPSRTVSPHPVPHQRDGIGHESRRRTGTTEGDKPRWTRLAAMERESAGRGGAHLKTGGATGPLPSPLRLTVPRWRLTTLAGRPFYGKTRRVPSARNVPPAPSSSEPMSTALESGVSAAVASRRGGW